MTGKVGLFPVATPDSERPTVETPVSDTESPFEPCPSCGAGHTQIVATGLPDLPWSVEHRGEAHFIAFDASTRPRALDKWNEFARRVK
jgi:hypothetical protein